MRPLDFHASLERAFAETGTGPAVSLTSHGLPATDRSSSIMRRLFRAGGWLRRLALQALAPSKSRRLRVSETISLGDKRSLAIVEIDGVDYLIGAGSATVTLLTRLNQPAGSPFQAAVDQAWQETETA